eukprot:TRINITY_DN3764_c0_g2_i1.p1 TRINITY_DN3764_c0_g2~~TRINITY_DN3764_c0_g2_i1.p1  ORF type:complete len:411 (-),score=132.23 TRINITY_DN3764_c0_g2_i1:39-1271(-)
MKRKALDSSDGGGPPEEMSAKPDDGAAPTNAAAAAASASVIRPEARARKATLSIAFPGSILQNCQTRELQAYVLGQVARTAAIFRVDEVIVFAEKPGAAAGDPPQPHQHHREEFNDEETAKEFQQMQQQAMTAAAATDNTKKRFDPEVFAIRQLQYLETPQYLRKLLFPLDPDLRFAGLQNPLDAPHHVRATEKSAFREGVVVPKLAGTAEHKGETNHLAECGLQGLVDIQEELPVRSRITVRMIETIPDISRSSAKRRKQQNQGKKKKLLGEVVQRRTPVEELNVYWGYQTRLCKNGLSQVLAECPFEGGYDMAIGTSDRGVSIHSQEFFKAVQDKTAPTKHVLIVFGGLRGIESCIVGDPALSDISYAEELFDHYVNSCPGQGSRTIRTEEAVMITLAALQPILDTIG